VTPPEVVEAVARHYGYTRADLLGPRGPAYLALVRQVAYYVLHRGGLSLAAIGRATGDRHYTTVTHGISNVREVMSSDPGFAAYVETLCDVCLPLTGAPAAGARSR